MKTTLVLGMMSIVSANVCTDPATTRETFIESQCCSRMCGEVCASDAGCISGKCLEKCCTFNDVNCAVCIDDGSCGTCNAGFSVKSKFHESAGNFGRLGLPLTNQQKTVLSGNGNVWAVSSNAAANNNKGRIQVYQWNSVSSEWEPRGGPIDGTTLAARLSIDLNEDGTVLARGERSYDHNNVRDVGRVQVFDWDGNDWSPRDEIVGEEKEFNYFGSAVSLSSDGTLLAVSTNFDWSNYKHQGSVQVYKWTGTSWQTHGKQLDGMYAEHYFGYFLSISGDGTKLAIISYMYNSNYSFGDVEYTDGVYVYSWVGNDWGSLKKVENLHYPERVDFSKDGSVVIVGSQNRPINGKYVGNAQVYEVTDSGLVQRGNDLHDTLPLNQDNNLGSSVSINSDGTAITVGAMGYDSNKGYFAVLDWTGTAWEKRQEFYGTDAGDMMGKSSSMSTDGVRVVFSTKASEAEAHNWNSNCPTGASECCTYDST